jgi:hypothetical protein
MKRGPKLALVILLLSGGATPHACYTRGGGRVELNRASHVILRGWEDADPRRPYVLTDRDSIRKLLAFVARLDRGWQPAVEFEEPRIRAEFREGSRILYVLALTGANYDDVAPPTWFLRTRGAGRREMRVASRAEAWEFLSFFGIVGFTTIR